MQCAHYLKQSIVKNQTGDRKERKIPTESLKSMTCTHYSKQKKMNSITYGVQSSKRKFKFTGPKQILDFFFLYSAK